MTTILIILSVLYLLFLSTISLIILTSLAHNISQYLKARAEVYKQLSYEREGETGEEQADLAYDENGVYIKYHKLN